MYEVTMPKLSDSMEVGKIIEWRVREGDAVHEGDVLAEVESDKAVMELESFHAGTVQRIVHGDGEEVPIGEVIAFVAAPGEQEQPAPQVQPAARDEEPAPAGPAPAAPPRPRAEPSAPAAGERAVVSPYARRLAEERGVDLGAVAGTGPGGRVTAKDVQQAASGAPRAVTPSPAAPRRPTGPINAEPLAAALAIRYGLDLTALSGTGPDGLLTVEDVEAAHHGALEEARVPQPDEELPPLEVAPDEADVEEASFRLKTQARRVVASKHAIPHFYLTRGVDVTALMARRQALKQEGGATVTHVVMLACIRALREHPAVNWSWDHGRIIKWRGVHLGVAVGTDQGLTVAVLRDAQEMGLAEIVAKTADLVERARTGRLAAEERLHATFTVTNLGMYDVEQFDPIINPPSAVTLAVSSALPAPLVREGRVEAGMVMELTAACDHRMVDGVAAAQFMQTLRDLLEHPEKLLGD